MPSMRRLKILAFVTALAAGGTARAQTAPALEVEPGARQALNRMSTYLGTLRTFEIKTETSLDLVTQTGQRVQLDGSANYKVRRPDAFVISVDTDLKKRTFYYDGKQFVVFAPELGFYASAPAPATIIQTLDAIDQKYGISLPIEDLFRWSNPKDGQAPELQSAFDAGPATIDGVKTKHYVFRQGAVDWQVWIEEGDRPLPRKLVIIDRSDPAFPTYSARLTWTLDPAFGAEAFAFRPGPTAKAIRLAVLDGMK